MKTYIPTGICPKAINYKVKNGIVKEVNFEGGCDGNLKGLVALLIDRPVDEVVEKLSGITCGKKSTSCPAELAKALTSK